MVKANSQYNSIMQRRLFEIIKIKMIGDGEKIMIGNAEVIWCWFLGKIKNLTFRVHS
jgi:hypothetical protein